MVLEILLTLVIGFQLLSIILLCNPARLLKEYGIGVEGPGSRRLRLLESVKARAGDEEGLILSNVIIMRSKYQLTKVIIHKVLAALAQSHPLLRMRLGKENGQFTSLKEIEEFEVDLEVCDNKDWQRIMEEQIPKLFNAEKGPLWRVRFIPDTWYDDGQQDGYPYQAACVFDFHHFITDRPFYNRLIGEFLSGLDEILDDDGSSVEPTSLLPPFDAYDDIKRQKSIFVSCWRVDLNQ